MEIVASNFLWWKALDFASAKLKEVGKFLNFGYRNRSRKEKCFLPHGRRNLGSIEYIKYWYQEITAELLIGADYDFILSWGRNMRPSLVSTPHYILKNWLRNFSSQGQMTEWRLGPQHNLLNTATLQTNSVDYLKKTHLSYEGKKLSPPPICSICFYSDMWTKFSLEYFWNKWWLFLCHLTFWGRHSGLTFKNFL